MTHKEELEALLAKIEGGNVTMIQFHEALQRDGLNATSAYNGSLDAAKALHDAALPEWATWSVDHSVFGYEFSLMKGHLFASGCSKEGPARAWLIAIIKALIAKEGDT